MGNAGNVRNRFIADALFRQILDVFSHLVSRHQAVPFAALTSCFALRFIIGIRRPARQAATAAHIPDPVAVRLVFGEL
jgi:hypothetical protein